MRKILIATTLLLAPLCLCAVAVADDAPVPAAEKVAQAEVDIELPETAPADDEAACESNEPLVVGLDELLADEPAVDFVCSCIDLCQSDAQCAFRNGPGSTCEPQGPCDCKECTANM